MSQRPFVLTFLDNASCTRTTVKIEPLHGKEVYLQSVFGEVVPTNAVIVPQAQPTCAEELLYDLKDFAHIHVSVGSNLPEVAHKSTQTEGFVRSLSDSQSQTAPAEAEQSGVVPPEQPQTQSQPAAGRPTF